MKPMRSQVQILLMLSCSAISILWHISMSTEHLNVTMSIERPHLNYATCMAEVEALDAERTRRVAPGVDRNLQHLRIASRQTLFPLKSYVCTGTFPRLHRHFVLAGHEE